MKLRAEELTAALIGLVKMAGDLALGNRPEAEIQRYLAHLAEHDCFAWAGDTTGGKVQVYGLLTIWPVAHDFLVWCPDEPVVGAYPDWDADTLYIGELILTGPAHERGRQLQLMVQSLALKHPGAMEKPWRAHRAGQVVNMDRWKERLK